MLFEDVVKKSNSILIEGDKRSGKFLLSLYLIDILGSKKNLIFSFYEKVIFLKRLESAKNLLYGKYENLLKNLFFLNIKSNYKTLKQKYGYKFLFEDIKKANEQQFTADLMLLHRPDLIFDINDYEEAEEFFLELINYCNEKDIKMIFTTNGKDEKENFLIDFLENYIDLNISTIKNSSYEIEIKSSLFPVDYINYNFIYENKTLRLEPKNEKENIINSLDIKKKILLICEDEELIKLHEYVLKNEKEIELEIVKNVALAIQKVLENPDIIIYYDNSGEVNLEICEVAKNNNLKPDILYIVKKDFVRNSDILSAIKRGCFDVLPKNFRFENYIIELQKLLNNYFYSNKIEKIPNFKKVDSKRFFEIISEYIKEGIFFTVIKIKKSLSDIEKILRNKDIICIEKESTYILVLDIRKIDIDIILNKLELKKEDVEIFECDEIVSIDMLRK